MNSIVAVHNTSVASAAFKQVLELTLQVPVKAFHVDPKDSIAEVLPRLNQECSDTDLLYVNGGLSFQESRQSRSHLGGLEFLLHVRLAPKLAPLSHLRAVLGVFEEPSDLIRRTPDNCMICSPGTRHLNPLSLLCGIQTLIKSGGFEEGRLQEILPFVFLTAFDEQRQSHGLLNRAGIGKLILECAADIVGEGHFFVKQFQQLLNSDLWAKKVLTLKPDLLTPRPATKEALSHVRRRFAALNGRPVAVHIDDEHTQGWSFGLYSALTGQSCDPKRFRDRGVTNSPCGRVTCIDNSDDASQFFRQKQAEFESKLSEWAEAEHNTMVAIVAATKARLHAGNLQQQLQKAQTERQNAKQSQEAAKTLLVSRHSMCLEQVDRFKELALEVAVGDDVPGLELLDSVPEVRKFIPIFKESMEAYEKAVRAAEQAEQLFSKLAAKFDHLVAENQGAHEAAMGAERERDSSLKRKGGLEKELSLAYPCSFVFLDLRLNPQEDESCAVEDTTGMRLLGQIKRTFPCLPIVMTTASQQAASSETARSVGSSGYWIKGVHSGDYLAEVLEAVIDQAELRECWVKLKMLQTKRRWWCVQYDDKSHQVIPRVLFHPHESSDVASRVRSLVPLPERPDERLNEAMADRRLILEKLEEALMLLFQFGASRRSDALCRRDYPFDQIVLTMGQIQEMRFKAVREKLWEEAYAQLGSKQSAELERDLRRLRNDIAHAGDPFGSREEARKRALTFLGHTLDTLLLNRAFKPVHITPLFLREMGMD